MSWIGTLGWFFALLNLGLFLWAEYEKIKIQRTALNLFLQDYVNQQGYVKYDKQGNEKTDPEAK